MVVPIMMNKNVPKDKREKESNKERKEENREREKERKVVTPTRLLIINDDNDYKLNETL